MKISDEAMRDIFRGVCSELGTDPYLSDLLNSAADSINESKDFADASQREKIFYSIVMGFSIQKVVQEQLLLDLSQKQLSKKMDGYEAMDEDETTHIILVNRDEFKTDDEAEQFCHQQLKSMGAQCVKVKKLTEFELMQHKRLCMKAMKGE